MLHKWWHYETMKFKELQSSKENIIPLWLWNKCLRPFRNFIGILEPSKKCEESVKVFLRLGKIQNEGSTKALFVWIPCLLSSHQMQNSEFCQHCFFCPLELKNPFSVPYSVDSIKRTVLLKVLLLKKNFKKSLLKILFTISKQYF